jgi:shikimate kinase
MIQLNSILFLIGMPGVGKSYWGKKMANKWNLPHIDLDKEIENNEQLSIPTIMHKYGETHFRALESVNLKNIIDKHKNAQLIISCGGGTPCYNNNLEVMLNNGIVVYLKAALDEIIKNLSISLNERPLLNHNVSLENQLNKLLEERKKYYERAHHTIIITDNMDVLSKFEALK